MSLWIEQFVERAGMAGAEIERIPSLDEAVVFLKNFFLENRLQTAIISPELKRRDLFRTEFSGFPTGLKEGSLWVEAGLGAADWGIAETGTLVRFDRGDEEKNVWTLPEICLCLLEEARIVPRLEDISAEIAGHLSPTALPSPQVSLITGPSRTSDIESVLTIGVHGPSRLIIVLIAESPGQATRAHVPR